MELDCVCFILTFLVVIDSTSGQQLDILEYKPQPKLKEKYDKN